MSDSDSRFHDHGAKRKKRNQFISVLIIVAIVLLGVIVWGWFELEKSRNAERIKNALNSQVEPGFKEPTDGGIDSEVQPFTDTETVVVQDTPSAPIDTVPDPIPVEPENPVVVPVPPEKQVKVVTRPAKIKTEVSKQTEPVNQPKYVEPVKPVPEPDAVPVKPEPMVEKIPEIKAAPVVPSEPVIVAPKTPKVATPAPAPAPAPKAFPPEDLPLPKKTEATEEARLAMVTIPTPEVRTKSGKDSTEALSGGSNSFKLGLSAYRQQDYVNAIRSFTAISKPTTKKRGGLEREEYVQANFLKGVSLLKVGHMSEAVSAFLNVLEYEKYYPLANMNLGICYVEMKQYAKAHQAFEAVIRDQSFIETAVFDDVMQRTKYFWALAWTRLYKNATNPDKQNYYRQQAVLKWKDYDVWFSKNDKYKTENQKAENYLKSLSSL